MKRKAFTLVELLLVIAIVGLLAVIFTPRVIGLFEQSKKDILSYNAMLIANEIETMYESKYMDGEEFEFGDSINRIQCPSEINTSNDFDCTYYYGKLNEEDTEEYIIVVLSGKENGKYAGYEALGTKQSAKAEKGKIEDIAIITLIFDADGGIIKDDKNATWELSEDKKTATMHIIKNGTIGNLPEAYKNEDYGFNGWNMRVLSDTQINLNEITLKATYSKLNYNILIDNDGGSGESSVSVRINEIFPNISIPNKEGYNFIGYYTRSKCNGEKIYSSDGKSEVRFDDKEINNLYACWEKKPTIKFTYTGNFTFSGTCNNGVCSTSEDDWDIHFKSGGIFKVMEINSNIDLFIVGGGGNGSIAYSNGTLYSGAGGCGGSINTQKNITISKTSYTINIGNATEPSSAFNYSAAGGESARNQVNAPTPGINSKKGGNGIAWCPDNVIPTNGEQGVYAFGDSSLDGIVYGSGGGGGGIYYNKGLANCQRAGAYGGTGAGNGGGATGSYYGYNANPNTGGGGGGGMSYYYNGNFNWYQGGTGGSGIVIIRNKR